VKAVETDVELRSSDLRCICKHVLNFVSCLHRNQIDMIPLYIRGWLTSFQLVVAIFFPDVREDMFTC